MKIKALYKPVCVICALAVTALWFAGCSNDADPTVTTTTSYDVPSKTRETKPLPSYKLIECDPTNQSYDLSEYKVFDGDIGRALMTETDDAMLKEFAEKVSDRILSTDDISCEIMYQGFSFAIVKIGKFFEWQDRTGVEEQGYYGDKSLFFSYNNEPATGDITAGPGEHFDVYKDPSDHFIVVTQCRDYKIVYELFERAKEG